MRFTIRCYLLPGISPCNPSGSQRLRRRYRVLTQYFRADTILPRGSNALVTSQNREEIAAYLRRVADKLEQGAGITLTSDSESVTIEPPARPTFEVKAEREGPTDTPGELSIEFELEWDESGDGRGRSWE